MKVAYLGPQGTFSYEACNMYCKNKKQMIEYKTISETILALQNLEVDEAIIPIENSIQGCVTDAIDTLILSQDIKVKDELLLDIRQNLMTKEKIKLEDIEEVYSHPQALAQCKKFLETYLQNAKIIPVESTALAAERVKNSKEKIACIGNISCLERYNLYLGEKDIQDNDYNKTKFWILNREGNEELKHDKMSMLFSVKDKPGALYNVLKIFNKYNLNLTKIESRPAKTVLGEYIFLIDVSIENAKEEKAIQKLKKKGIFVRILGKY